jgi:hypothetical protein
MCCQFRNHNMHTQEWESKVQFAVTLVSPATTKAEKKERDTSGGATEKIRKDISYSTSLRVVGLSGARLKKNGQGSQSARRYHFITYHRAPTAWQIVCTVLWPQVESWQRLDPLPRPRHLPVETLCLALRRPKMKIKQIQHRLY